MCVAILMKQALMVRWGSSVAAIADEKHEESIKMKPPNINQQVLIASWPAIRVTYRHTNLVQQFNSKKEA